MSEPTEPYVYAGVGMIAVIAAVVAYASWDAGDPIPQPTADPAPSPRRSPASEDVGGVEIADAPEVAPLPDGFAPDLPEVPDLEAEPPPARPDPTEQDPRLAQLGAEMRVLSRARELLSEHPSEALGVLERHRREFPQGVLREEREAYAVEVLLALEHVDEAERRYYEFRRDFPDSDFVSRLEEMMQRPPHEVGAGGR